MIYRVLSLFYDATATYNIMINNKFRDDCMFQIRPIELCYEIANFANSLKVLSRVKKGFLEDF